jgi:uncharacterized protein (TIGR00369 family)
MLTSNIDELRRFFRSAPFMVELGIEPIECTPGRVVTRMPIAERHLQHTGQVHAGVSGAIADHTMGAAAQTMAPAGHWILTAEFKTSLLRGARGQWLECEAHVLKPGKLVMFTEAEVYAVDDDRRTLVAKASATMAVAKA